MEAHTQPQFRARTCSMAKSPSHGSWQRQKRRELCCCAPLSPSALQRLRGASPRPVHTENTQEILHKRAETHTHTYAHTGTRRATGARLQSSHRRTSQSHDARTCTYAMLPHERLEHGDQTNDVKTPSSLSLSLSPAPPYLSNTHARTHARKNKPAHLSLRLRQCPYCKVKR